METCRGAIHHFKLSILVSSKLLYSLLFRRVEFKFDRFLLSSLSHFSLLLLCIDCVCVCVSRSNWVTSVRFCTLWSLCSYPACACFYQRDNCIRWCWEYEKIGNDRFSPFFTAVVEFPNYVITLSLLRTSRSDSTADFSVPVLFRISHQKRETFFFFFLSLKMYIKQRQPHPGGQKRDPGEAGYGCCFRSTPHPPTPSLWVAALWWLSVSLVMSLAALTQVICMRADSGGDVQQRQWCTYHFPQWLIEDCNLGWTFSLITCVSGSKTRTLSCHWALDSSRAFSLQEDWSPPLRWAQFSSHLHYCYKCRIECIC